MDNMTSSFDAMIVNKIGKAVEKAIMDNMTSYNSPIHKIVNNSVAKHEDKIIEITDKAVSGLFDSDSFKEGITQAVRSKLAKLLVSKIGGELERTVVKLKADTVSRAKMALAVDGVIKELLINQK